MIPESRIPARCSVLVVGSGPAGLFAADELRRAGLERVMVVDQGKSMPARVCPDGAGCDCRLCDVLEGEGGAGSFSDGKITLSATRGTHGGTIFSDEHAALLDQIEARIRSFVPDGAHYKPTDYRTATDRETANGLRFDSYRLLHIGSDGVRRFGEYYSAFLQQYGVSVLTGVEARELIVTGGQASGALLYERRTRAEHPVRADAVIAASGLAGTPWLEDQLRRAGVALSTGPADIGIRLETSADVLEPLISQFYDFKLAGTSAAGLAVRSFCVNGNGFVVNEYHRPLGIRGVNGHSFLDRRSGLSNLAILATLDETFTADPKAYVREMARQINHGAAGYPVRQTLGSFLHARDAARPPDLHPSNPKTRPGRLDLLLPPVLHQAFTGYIDALAAMLAPLRSLDGYVYAPEIKYYDYRVPSTCTRGRAPTYPACSSSATPPATPPA